MEYFIPGVLILACVTLALWAYSLYRKERVEARTRALTDQELYRAGEAKAATRVNKSRGRFGSALHEAGSNTAPLQWLGGVFCLAFLACSVGVALSSRLLVGAAAGGAVVGGAFMRLKMLRRRRRALFDVQLARILPQISASVRSSLTLERALRLAAGYAQDPLQEGLTRVLGDAAYGMSLAAAFDDMAQRTGSPDIRALAAALRIQQKFGGALAPALDMITAHAVARLKASAELKTELAGTQLAKWFVAASMPIIFLLMFITNTDFARFYTEEPVGWLVMGIAAFLEVCGLVACQRITSCRKLES